METMLFLSGYTWREFLLRNKIPALYRRAVRLASSLFVLFLIKTGAIGKIVLDNWQFLVIFLASFQCKYPFTGEHSCRVCTLVWTLRTLV